MSSIRRPDYRSAAPELPDQPIRLTPVYAWVGLLIAAGALLAILLWGFFGSLTLTVERAGTLTLQNQKPEAVAYIDASRANMAQPGIYASVIHGVTGEQFEGEVTRVALSPTTPEQAAAVSGEDLLDASQIYEIRVTLNSSIFVEGTPCNISILTGETHPISRVLPIFS